MSRKVLFALFFLAVFLQSGAYGLTFMLPELFESFGANEKVVGSMLFITAMVTIISVYFSGHISDKFGRIMTLGIACFSIAISLYLYAISETVGVGLIIASALLGFGWGNTYTLIPIALAQMVEEHERVSYFSLLSVFVMAGFGLAPVMVSLLQTHDVSIPNSFMLTSAFCFVSGLLFVFLRPVFKEYSRDESGEKSKITFHSVISVFKSSALLPIIMVCLGASVFAGLNNFQTVFAEDRGLNYAYFFFTYTVTVVIFRLLLVKFKGGKNPYRTITILQYVMFASVVFFILMPNNELLYILFAFLFGIGYGVSYPILAAMAANDANKELLPQTMQLFSLTYFIGIFGFPLIAGWLIVDYSTTLLLVFVALMAFIEATMAFRRSITRANNL